MIDADIYQALQSLVGGRVFPDVADFNTPRPYVIYQQVGGQAINYTSAAIPSLRHARIQVTVWADSRDDARAVAQQVEDAMRTTFKAAAIGAAIGMVESDINRYSSQQDFSFHYSA